MKKLFTARNVACGVGALLICVLLVKSLSGTCASLQNQNQRLMLENAQLKAELKTRPTTLNAQLQAAPAAADPTSTAFAAPDPSSSRQAASAAAASLPDPASFRIPVPRHPMAVDCNKIKWRLPVRATQMKSKGQPFMVSYSWWDDRGTSASQETGWFSWMTGKKKTWEEMQLADWNDSVQTVQELVLASDKGAALLDVGANVGFMTFMSATVDRPVYSFDPISYDISKLCEGVHANLAAGLMTYEQADKYVNIFHAAVGPVSQDQVEMTRPADSVGYFDQSSLKADALLMAENVKVKETVPMMALDDVLPEDLIIGVMKVDVQGHEEGVFQGMIKTLNKKTGYPKKILFEDVPNLVTRAGYEPGNCVKILESAGYTCATGHTGQSDMDVLCSKR